MQSKFDCDHTVMRMGCSCFCDEASFGATKIKSDSICKNYEDMNGHGWMDPGEVGYGDKGGADVFNLAMCGTLVADQPIICKEYKLNDDGTKYVDSNGNPKCNKSTQCAGAFFFYDTDRKWCFCATDSCSGFNDGLGYNVYRNTCINLNKWHDVDGDECTTSYYSTDWCSGGAVTDQAMIDTYKPQDNVGPEDACCACGGGVQGGGDKCFDNLGWVDSGGDNCVWYEEHQDNKQYYGNACSEGKVTNMNTVQAYPNSDGVNAAEACCVCGGGTVGENDFTYRESNKYCVDQWDLNEGPNWDDLAYLGLSDCAAAVRRETASSSRQGNQGNCVAGYFSYDAINSYCYCSARGSDCGNVANWEDYDGENLYFMCKDRTNWMDTDGDNCETHYYAETWCENGTVTDPQNVSKYADNSGVSAAEACCNCGGGV